MDEIELKYQSILIVGKLGGWEYNMNTNELFCSHEYFALLGRGEDYPASWAKYPVKEVWEDLIHPDDLENAKNIFANYLIKNDGSLYEQKFRLKHADGHYLNILSRAKPLLEKENKKFSGIIVGVHIDITELMEVKDELADNKKMNELRYKALFEGANDAVFIAEAETGFIVDVNEIGCALMGKTKKELVGTHQSELHPLEELAMIKEQFEQFSKTDTYKVVYCSVLHKSGKRIPVRITGTKPFLVEGKLFSAGFFHDCTNENDAKNIAIELTELLSKAEGIAHLGSIEINLITGDQIWSEEFYHILGLKTSTIPPDQDFFFKLIHPDDHGRFDEWYRTSLNNIGESIPIEIRLTAVDGLDKNLLVSAFTNVDTAGKLTKYIGVVKDVTNETLTLNALRKQNKQLKEIAWAQSHLVRAPLSRLLGLINLMQKGILKREEEIEFLGHIKDSAEELDTVIKDVVFKANGI